jgi:hypothetical protein
MREENVRQWCRKFKYGRKNVHDEERSGRPAICSVMILFKVFNKNFVKDGASQFQNFRVNFHKFYALLFTRLSQLGQAIITSFAQDWFRKCSRVRTKCSELFLL